MLILAKAESSQAMFVLKVFTLMWVQLLVGAFTLRVWIARDKKLHDIVWV